MTGGWKKSHTLVAVLGTAVAAALVLAPSVLVATAQGPQFNENFDCVRYCPPTPTPATPTPPRPTPPTPGGPGHYTVDVDQSTKKATLLFAPPVTGGTDVPFVSGVIIALSDGSTSAVTVSTQRTAAAPAGVTPPPVGTNQVIVGFLEISVETGETAGVSEAVITFSLSDAQLVALGLDPNTIVLHRLVAGSWVALPTTYVGGASDAGGFHNFQAVSPGFSNFAISGAKATTTSTGTPLEQTSTGGSSTFTCSDGRKVPAGQGCPLEQTSTPPPTGGDPGTPAEPPQGGVPGPGLGLALAAIAVAFLVVGRRKR